MPGLGYLPGWVTVLTCPGAAAFECSAPLAAASGPLHTAIVAATEHKMPAAIGSDPCGSASAHCRSEYVEQARGR